MLAFFFEDDTFPAFEQGWQMKPPRMRRNAMQKKTILIPSLYPDQLFGIGAALCLSPDKKGSCESVIVNVAQF